MSNISTDPKFQPSKEILTLVKVPQAACDGKESTKKLGAAFQAASNTQEMLNVTKAGIIYILKTRGVTHTDIIKECDTNERDITRFYNLGCAIFRTQEITRTMSAVTRGELSHTAITAATDGNASAATKIERLEAEAVRNHVIRRFQTTGGKKPSESLVAKATKAAMSAAKANNTPATADAYVQQLPAVSQEVGLTAKTREPQTTEVGANAPMPVAFWLARALTDAKQMVKDSDGLAYDPTPEDLAALLSLMAYLPALAAEPAVSDLVADASASVV